LPAHPVEPGMVDPDSRLVRPREDGDDFGDHAVIDAEAASWASIGASHVSEAQSFFEIPSGHGWIECTRRCRPTMLERVQSLLAGRTRGGGPRRTDHFGGRADIMDLFDARRAGSLSHGGTFNGNPVAAAAGLATLLELTPDVFARLDALGERLRAQVAEAIGRDGLDARIAVVGSLFQVWSGEGVSAVATGVGGVPEFFLGLLLEGFYLAPRGMGAIPAIATESDVDDLAAAIGRVLLSMQRVAQIA
jgi:hypothetical protein